ncbi:MAG: dihydrofolate reductase, partial [Ghiorsea sp.]
QADLHLEGATVVHDLDALIDAFADSEEELMVMGGAEIYALLLPFAQRMYCTKLAHAFTGDAWFPEYDSEVWTQTHREQHQADEKNAYDYCFEIYQHR